MGLAPSADADAASSPERAKEPRPNSMRQADNHSRDEDNNGRAARRAARRNQNPDADDDLLPPMEPRTAVVSWDKTMTTMTRRRASRRSYCAANAPFARCRANAPAADGQLRAPTMRRTNPRAVICHRNPGACKQTGLRSKDCGSAASALSAWRQSSSTSTNTSSDSSSRSGNEQGEGGGDCNGDDNSLHANCPHCKALTIAPVPDRGKIAYLRCFQCRKMYGVRVPRDMADQRPRSARGSSARRGSKNSVWDRDDGPGIRKLGAVRRSMDEEYDRAVEIQ